MSVSNMDHPQERRQFEEANRLLNAFVSTVYSPQSRVEFPHSCGDGQPPTLGVKDNIGVEGFPLAAGLAVAVLDRDEAVSGTWVKWLVGRGFVIKGKTNMYELGYGAPGCGLPPAVNPWDHSLIPGGSSSGSAVAVAAGLCTVALGTDAAGSVRIPAEYCGVLSYKPSGKQPWHKDGIWPGPSTLDGIGVMARDWDRMVEAVPSPGDRGGVGDENITRAISGSERDAFCIGILDLEGEEVDDDHALLLDEVRSWAQSRGYATVSVQMPGLGSQVRDAIWKIFAYEYSGALEANLTAGAKAVLSAPSLQLLSDGPKTSRQDYSAALNARNRFQQQYAEQLSHCHAVVTPVTPVRPYSLAWSRAFARCEEDDSSGSPIDLSNVEALLTRKTRYTAPINLVEYPTLTLPMRRHRDGLPVGIQIASVPQNEAAMWIVARRLWQDIGPQAVRQDGRGELYGSFANS